MKPNPEGLILNDFNKMDVISTVANSKSTIKYQLILIVLDVIIE